MEKEAEERRAERRKRREEEEKREAERIKARDERAKQREDERRRREEEYEKERQERRRLREEQDRKDRETRSASRRDSMVDVQSTETKEPKEVDEKDQRMTLIGLDGGIVHETVVGMIDEVARETRELTVIATPDDLPLLKRRNLETKKYVALDDPRSSKKKSPKTRVRIEKREKQDAESPPNHPVVHQLL